MLVNSNKLRALRRSRNWTQQHLAQLCDVSMRTIQRVERDGVASNETVAAYASVFEIEASELIISTEQYERKDKHVVLPPMMVGLLVLSSFVAGIGFTLCFL